MARKRNPQTTADVSTRRTRRSTETADAQQEASRTSPGPAAALLLGNASIQRRGNGPVRQAAILQLQQTQGNRATQHSLKSPGGGESPAVMQRLPANRSAMVAVQRDDARDMEGMDAAQRQAYEAATPTPLNNMNDLIQLIERVEKAYSGDNWQGITTRVRKAYYDDAAWDKMIKNRQTHARAATPPLSVQDYKALVTAKQHPEINLNGESIDMGHVFTGIDAQNFPETGGAIRASRVDGPPGATWAGDVGSALAEWDLHAKKDRGRHQEFYDKYASKDDMLGDVDGLAVTKLNVGGPGGIQGSDTLSNRLRAYYLGTGGGKSGTSQRFTKFAEASNFKWTGRGGGIKLEQEARDKIRSQVDNFGVAWLRKEKGAFGGAGTNWFHSEDLDWFVNRFISWVEQGLAAENP